MSLKTVIFDAAPSQRRVDENGFMHVDSCHITKEQVVKYYGREIPGWRELGLDPERLYNVYRPGDEIEKAAATFDGLPLQLQHHIDSADEPQTEFRVGSISRPVWRAPYLDCDLHITNGAAISAVEHGDFKEISAAYLYEPVIESGEFDGTPYEIVMRNLRGNHVALVPKGRAGADVVVADEAPDAPPLRSFAAWMRKNPLSLKDAPSPEWENVKAAMDDAWITVQSNGGGRHVLLGDDGTIKSGMGGKFNGQRIDLIPRKPKAPPTGNEPIRQTSTRYTIAKPTAMGSNSNEFSDYNDAHAAYESKFGKIDTLMTSSFSGLGVSNAEKLTDKSISTAAGADVAEQFRKAGFYERFNPRYAQQIKNTIPKVKSALDKMESKIDAAEKNLQLDERMTFLNGLRGEGGERLKNWMVDEINTHVMPRLQNERRIIAAERQYLQKLESQVDATLAKRK